VLSNQTVSSELHQVSKSLERSSNIVIKNTAYSTTMSRQTVSHKKPASGKTSQNQNPFAVVFKTQQEKHKYYKNRAILIEDVLIDLSCAKNLLDIAENNGHGPRILNEQIAQFGLQAMHFCKWKEVNWSADFVDKVAQRYIPLGEHDLSVENARKQVSSTQRSMERLANGVSIRQLCGSAKAPAQYLNVRIAIFGLQALSTLKDIGIEKDVVFEAMAKILSGMAYDRACQEATSENEERLKALQGEAATAKRGEFDWILPLHNTLKADERLDGKKQAE
jgi:hypothetical protein